MEEKQRQIEEMVLDMFDYSRTLVNITTATEDSNFINRYKEALRGYATYLVDKGYCKLQEDETVLPKDEYRYLKNMADRFDPFWFCSFGGCEGACKECKDTCEMSIFVKERKATAEKYFHKIIELLKEVRQDGVVPPGELVFMHEKNQEIAKELGVNIKEN